MELLDLGYLGLFLGAFLSATIIPFPSEGLLIGFYALGYDSITCITIATIGNVLGSVTNYCLGYWGSSDSLVTKFKINREKLTKWENHFSRWGMYLGLLAWLPIIGDPMIVALGFLRVPFKGLLLMIFIGKLIRYIILTLAYLSLI